MKSRLPKSGIENLLRTYPDAKKFVNLSKEFGIKDTVEKVATAAPAPAALSFLLACVLYPAITREGAEGVLTYNAGNELNEYWAIVRLHYCCLGDEYVFKMLQAYAGIDEIRKECLMFSRNLDISDFDVFQRVASVLYTAEAGQNIVQQNDETLIDITEFEDPNSDMYSWCKH